MYYCYFDTPIGELLLAGEADSLSMIASSASILQASEKTSIWHCRCPALSFKSRSSRLCRKFLMARRFPTVLSRN